MAQNGGFVLCASSDGPIFVESQGVQPLEFANAKPVVSILSLGFTRKYVSGVYNCVCYDANVTRMALAIARCRHCAATANTSVESMAHLAQRRSSKAPGTVIYRDSYVSATAHVWNQFSHHWIQRAMAKDVNVLKVLKKDAQKRQKQPSRPSKPAIWLKNQGAQQPWKEMNI